MPEKDYISKAYSALRDNLEGFSKDEATFRTEMQNPDYVKKAYAALKDNLDGFSTTEQDFYNQVGLKKKAGSEPLSTGSPTSSRETANGERNDVNFGYRSLDEAIAALPQKEPAKLPRAILNTNKPDATQAGTTSPPIVSKGNKLKEVKNTADFNEKWDTKHTATDMVTGSHMDEVDERRKQNLEYQKDAGVVKETIESAAAGLDAAYSMVLQMPNMLYNTFAIPVNAAIDAMGGKGEIKADPEGILAKSADYYANRAKELLTQQQKKYDKTLVDEFNEGDKGKAIHQLVNSTIRMLPPMMAMAGASFAGASAASVEIGGALGFGSEKYNEIKDLPLPESVKQRNALASGMLTSMFNKWSLDKIAIPVAKTLATKGEQAAVQVAKETFEETYKQVFKKLAPVTEPLHSGIAFAATGFATNVLDKITGVSPDKDLTEGIPDMFIEGIALGTGIHAGKRILNRERAQTIDQLHNEAEQIKNDADNPEVNPDLKESLLQTYQDKTEQLNIEMEKERENALKYSEEEKTIVEDLSNKVQQNNKILADPAISPETKNLKIVENDKLNGEIDKLNKEAEKRTTADVDKIIEKKQKKLGLPTTPEIPLSIEHQDILDNMENGTTLDANDITSLSDELYKRLKGIEAIKSQAGRRFTIKQIDEASKDLSSKIDALETAKIKLEESGKEFIKVDEIKEDKIEQSIATEPVSKIPNKKEENIHNSTSTFDTKSEGGKVEEAGTVQKGELKPKEESASAVEQFIEEQKNAKTSVRKKEIQIKIDKAVEKLIPDHNTRETGEVKLSDKVDASIENIEMPDGEEGYRISVKDADGKELDSQDFYDKPEVVKYLNGKQKGYDLAKTEKPKSEIKESESEIKVGSEVSYRDNSGTMEKGTVESVEGSEVKIKGPNGTIHRRTVEDIQREQVLSTLTESKSEIDNAISLPKVEPDTDAKDIVQAKILPVKEAISAVFKGLNVIQDKTMGKMVDHAETWLSGKIKQWSVNQNTALRTIGTGLTSYANGLPRNIQETANKKYLTGGIKFAQETMSRNIDALRKLIDNDLVSMERVHEVLDPDFYKEDKSKVVTKYDDLNTSEKQLADTLRAMLDYVHNYNFAMGMIDVDTYNKFKGKYTPRLYESFEVPVEVQGAIEEHNNYISNKLITDIFKQRKEITDEMRKTILKDPIYATAKRMMQTEVNASVLSYLENVKKDPLLVSDVAQKGFSQLNGKGYGPLNGKFVADYIVEDLKGYFFANDGLDLIYNVFKVYDKIKLRQFFKKLHTVWEPAVQLGNFTSNFTFAFIGGLDPITYGGNLRKAAKEIKNKGPVYDLLVKSGIIGSDVLSSDLLPLTANTPTPVIKEQNAFMKVVGKIDDFTMKLYEETDNNAKVAAYMGFREYGYSEPEAIRKVYESFQNYATVGKIWDAASKTPGVGNPYVKFQADLQRILKNAALKRPLTTAMYAGMIYGLSQVASSLSDEDDAHKALREGREYIPKMDFGIGSIPLTFKTPTGEVNLARYLSPYYITDIGGGEHPIEAWSKMLPYKFKYSEGPAKGILSWLPPFSADDPMVGVWYAALIGDKDFRGKSISDPLATRYTTSGLTDTERAMNSINYIMRSQIPYYDKAQDMYMATTGGTDFYGRQKNGLQTIISILVKTQDFGDTQYNEIIEKKLKGFQYKMSDLEQDAKDVDATIKKVLTKKADLLKNKVITKEQFDNMIIDELENQRKRKVGILEKQAKVQEEINKYLEQVKDFIPNKK